MLHVTVIAAGLVGDLAPLDHLVDPQRVVSAPGIAGGMESGRDDCPNTTLEESLRGQDEPGVDLRPDVLSREHPEQERPTDRARIQVTAAVSREPRFSPGRRGRYAMSKDKRRGRPVPAL